MYDPRLKEYEDVLAARYALGIATSAEVAQAEQQLEANEHFIELVAEYDEIFSYDGSVNDNDAPPREIWDRIEAAIDRPENASPNHTNYGNWEVVAPGIERKALGSQDVDQGPVALYRVAPGACLPRADQPLPQTCLILDGEIEVNGITVRTGDLHAMRDNSTTRSITSRTGALLYIRAAGMPR